MNLPYRSETAVNKRKKFKMDKKSTYSSTKSNFGKIGWLYILFCVIALILMTSLTTDSLNVTVPRMAVERGWNQATLLSIFTYAGWVSVLGSIFIGWLLDRKGSRFVFGVSFLAGGLAYIWWGNCGTIWEYAVSASILACAANAYGMMCCSNLLAYWFPTKKGLALGWATIGNNLSPVIIVPVIGYLLPRIGIGKTSLIFGAIMLLMAVVSFFAIRNTPEELGCFSDNDPDFYDRHKEETQESTLTVWEILRNKNTWLCGIIYGFLMIVTVGLMSQFIPRLMSFGVEEGPATLLFSAVALIGAVGSYLWGWLDQKIGTKRCSVVFSLWFGIAVLFNVLPGRACLYISLVMIGCAIGGTTNLSASIVATLFGRFDFARAWMVVNPITAILRNCAYAILAVAMELTGSLDGAYLLFVGLCVVAAILSAVIKQKE